MTRNYTLYRFNDPNIGNLINNKKEKMGEIYMSEINDEKYHMMDVEIIKSEIDKEKILELINQIKNELHIS